MMICTCGATIDLAELVAEGQRECPECDRTVWASGGGALGAISRDMLVEEQGADDAEWEAARTIEVPDFPEA
jgi:hypothetical protein